MESFFSTSTIKFEKKKNAKVYKTQVFPTDWLFVTNEQILKHNILFFVKFLFLHPFVGINDFLFNSLNILFSSYDV